MCLISFSLQMNDVSVVTVVVVAASSSYSSSRSSNSSGSGSRGSRKKMLAKELQRGTSRSSCWEERQLRQKNNERGGKPRLWKAEACEVLSCMTQSQSLEPGHQLRTRTLVAAGDSGATACCSFCSEPWLLSVGTWMIKVA